MTLTYILPHSLTDVHILVTTVLTRTLPCEHVLMWPAVSYYFYSFTSLDITTYGAGQQLGCGSVTISILSLRWTSPYMERDGVSRDKRTLLSSGVSRIRQLAVGADLQTLSRH